MKASLYRAHERNSDLPWDLQYVAVGILGSATKQLQVKEEKKKKKNSWVDNLASSLPGLMCSVFLHKKETLYPRKSFLPSSQTQTHTHTHTHTHTLF